MLTSVDISTHSLVSTFVDMSSKTVKQTIFSDFEKLKENLCWPDILFNTLSKNV